MENLLKRKFADTLYNKRIELGLTQLEMAEKVFLSLRQYNDLENGLRLPSFESFVNIIIECELDSNALINDIIASGYAGNDNRNSA